MQRKIRITARDGHVCDAWRADPTGQAKGGVVVLHAVYGLTGHMGDVCARWAEMGYAAIAPALFDRQQRGVVHPYSRAGADAGIASYEALTEAQILADVAACRDALAPLRVAISGFCTGGTWAWRAASVLPFDAQVNFYGSHVPAHLELPQPAPTLMHYGDCDPIMPMAKVQSIMARHPEVDVRIYAGAGHAFCNPEQASYDAVAAEGAWARSAAFLDHHLGGTRDVPGP
ncbi:MAG: dienelactone hydrolase family protein [Beijerinckiaceae bacterium]|nr:dienelactone hydrolase family protein [Beijerinckiaceae bacterium]